MTTTQRLHAALETVTPGQIRLLAVVTSLLLSLWAVYQDNLINPDGILYLHAAKLLGQGQWQSAMQVYNWPLYPALIAITLKLTGLPPEYSAHLINASCFALLVFAFIGLVGQLGEQPNGTRTTLIIAALVILLYPQLNEYRSFIMRDSGYWAFYLLAVWAFVAYFRKPSLSLALGWGAAIGMACLFRVEGIAIMVLLPFTLLLRQNASLAQRFLLLGGAHLFSLAGLLVLVTWWVVSPDGFPRGMGRLAGDFSWLQTVFEGTSSHFAERVARLGDTVLDPLARDYAALALVAVMLSLLLASLFSTLGPIYALLLGYGFARGRIWSGFDQVARTIVAALLLIHLAILMLFIMKSFFMTGRYPLSMALTLMLGLPFYLTGLVHKQRTSLMRARAKQGLAILAGCGIVILAVDGLVSFGASNDHLKAAGLWVNQHAEARARLYTNERIQGYYAAAGRDVELKEGSWPETLQLFKSGEWQSFAYLVIRVRNPHLESELSAAMPPGIVPVKVFSNEKNNKVLIFKGM